MPRSLLALLLLAVLATSTSGVLVRVADAPALALAFWRCAGGALALAPFALRHDLSVKGRRGQLGASGVMLAAHFGLYIGAIGFTTVASAVTLTTMTPLFVGLGAWLVLAEPPTRRAWAGLAVATVGAVVIGAADIGAGAGPGGRSALVGDVMSVGAAVMVAGYLLIGRAARQTLPLSVYVVWVYGVAAGALLVVSAATGTPLTGYPRGTWLAILGLIVGPQLLGHTVYNHVLASLPATTVGVVALTEAIGAPLLAWLILGELPPALFALGAPLVLVGVWAASRPRAEGVLVAHQEDRSV